MKKKEAIRQYNILLREFKVSDEDIKSKSKRDYLVNYRRYISYLLADMRGASTFLVGDILNNERSTITHHCIIMRKWVRIYPSVKKEIDYLLVKTSDINNKDYIAKKIKMRNTVMDILNSELSFLTRKDKEIITDQISSNLINLVTK